MRACRQTACGCETDGGMRVDPVRVTVWTSMLKLWACPTMYERTARPRSEVLEGHKVSNAECEATTWVVAVQGLGQPTEVASQPKEEWGAIRLSGAPVSMPFAVEALG